MATVTPVWSYLVLLSNTYHLSSPSSGFWSLPSLIWSSPMLALHPTSVLLHNCLSPASLVLPAHPSHVIHHHHHLTLSYPHGIFVQQTCHIFPRTHVFSSSATHCQIVVILLIKSRWYDDVNPECEWYPDKTHQAFLQCCKFKAMSQLRHIDIYHDKIWQGSIGLVMPYYYYTGRVKQSYIGQHVSSNYCKIWSQQHQPKISYLQIQQGYICPIKPDHCTTSMIQTYIRLQFFHKSGKVLPAYQLLDSRQTLNDNFVTIIALVSHKRSG
jgi:hypothetical protein